MGEKPAGPRKIDVEEVLGDDWDPTGDPVELEIAGEDGEEVQPTRGSTVAVEADPTTPSREEADAEERNLRLRADFDNYRRRKDREIADLRKRAAEGLVSELLPVLDNLDRALGEEPPVDDSFHHGVELIRRQLLDILSRAGLEPISAVGEPFDPTYHEAVARQETAEPLPPTVVDELQKGYLFHGRLLRPAQVVVVVHTASDAAGGAPGPPDDPPEALG